jgi:hypothetical protein
VGRIAERGTIIVGRRLSKAPAGRETKRAGSADTSKDPGVGIEPVIEDRRQRTKEMDPE